MARLHETNEAPVAYACGSFTFTDLLDPLGDWASLM
jgi:hypothetical protein